MKPKWIKAYITYFTLLSPKNNCARYILRGYEINDVEKTG